MALAEANVNRALLGNPRRGAKALNTTARIPDQHAATEKTAPALAALLAGYRELSGAGNLGVDEVFSAQQLFVDFEILGHVVQIARGLQTGHAQGDAPERGGGTGRPRGGRPAGTSGGGFHDIGPRDQCVGPRQRHGGTMGRPEVARWCALDREREASGRRR